ncbi:hypothetical protein LEYRA_32 [Paenibacillus phage Leyra]|uniref:Uncharacterized protein n=1 Tax=Paenibacillus phage Leyra TaxID=2070192 RepID=A0A2I7SDD8_9CAUD|nr:hypothetical protein HWB47_gp32 [Paenibacillus phage Leyra]AUS03896.1 hypothetical protein LEYRA_32 [Paenibacillus phage Leyra]
MCKEIAPKLAGSHLENVPTVGPRIPIQE